MKAGKLSASIALLVCAFAQSRDSFAQSSDYRYDKSLSAAQSIAAIGDGLFGEGTDLASGQTAFSATDISLEGNSKLPVAITRRLEIGLTARTQNDLAFGDWDLEVPYIYGTYGSASGWQVSSSSPDNRCSVTSLAQATPPVVQGVGRTFPPSGFDGYWAGNHLHVPGAGDSEILYVRPETAVPTGFTTHWTTKNSWAIGCLPTLRSGGLGEGFLAVSPDGTRYHFDWMARLPIKSFIGPYQGRDVVQLTRDEIRIYPSLVEDRFGNWVKYEYQPNSHRVTKIEASDGRKLTFFYGDSEGRVTSVSDSVRTWTYQYVGTRAQATSQLVRVGLPDNSAWQYAMPGRMSFPSPLAFHNLCNPPAYLIDITRTGQIVHPSGAIGTFTFRRTRRGRTYVPGECSAPDAYVPSEAAEGYLAYPKTFDIPALVQKQIEGPGISPMQWNLSYNTNWIDNGDTTNETTVVDPDGVARVYTYGNRFGVSDGELERVDVLKGDTRHRSEETVYVRNASSVPFSASVGYTVQPYQDPITTELRHPTSSHTVTQDGVTFTRTITAFDAMARPIRMTESNSEGHSRSFQKTYYDHTGLWVLGQIASVSNVETGLVEALTEYSATNALPVRRWSFGKLKETLEYNGDGTLASLSDARDSPQFDTSVKYSNWKRGIPQVISLPSTLDNGPTTILATVDDFGSITSVTDGSGFTWSYGYDAMGRLSSIAYPQNDVIAWNSVQQDFEQVAVSEHGLPPGHWRLTRREGNKRSVTYFDAFFRPVFEERFDTSSPASAIQVARRFDSSGRAVFESYPRFGVAAFNDINLQGTRSEYDPLGRLTATRLDSDLGLLSTTAEYLPHLQIRVTNPRLAAHVTTYLAWGEPGTNWPVLTVSPEGVQTQFTRDIFGKALTMTRRDSSGSSQLTRNYVYNVNQELCNIIEPESGSKVMAYDAAGLLDWMASGQSSPQSGCDYARVPESAKVRNTYDSRGRIVAKTVPGVIGSSTFSYAPDGKIQSVQSYSTPTDVVRNSYTYNKRRFLINEVLDHGADVHWAFGYEYDANGNVLAHTYPSGERVLYSPNALGQPTHASSFASNVTFHPSGAIAGFTYGNGIVHSTVQNVRQAPDRRTDSYAGAKFLDDLYDYDANGNVAAISDGTTGARGDRTMTYDALDRLIGVTSPMFAAGVTYTYDALDNLRYLKAPGREYFYYYDQNWRLTNVLNGSGSSEIGLGYDSRGNLVNKNGQVFSFDMENRLQEASGDAYQYDGHGRRVRASSASGDILSFYGHDGVLRYQENRRTNQKQMYVYVGGRLVAEVSDPIVVVTAPNTAPSLSAPIFNTSGSFDVSWTAITSATSYHIEQSVNGGAWSAFRDETAMSFSVAGMNSGIYEYRASACNSAGCGPVSAAVRVQVARSITASPAATAPSQSYSGTYSITWSSVPEATYYRVEESANGGGWSLVQDGTSMNWSASGKSSGTFQYRIAACNAAGCGPPSIPVTVSVTLPPATPIISVPSTSTTGSYSVDWYAVATANNYQLEELVPAGSWTVIHNASSTGKALSGKVNGVYQYRVRACNIGGCSAISGAVSVTVAIPPPATPSGLTLDEERDEVGYVCTIDWTPSVGATSYQLRKGTTVVYTGSHTSTVRSGRCGTGYQVSACNAYGCSGWGP